MTPLLFWDVDTQVDFMLPEGKFHVPGAEEMLGRLRLLTGASRRYRIPVVASADDHEGSDPEISDSPDFETTYPPHCMRGTPGAEKVPETRIEGAVQIGHRPLAEDELRVRLSGRAPAVVILKKELDVFTNPNTEKVLEALAPEHIVLYGVALDICNRFAVEGLLARGYTGLAVVSDASQAVDPERGAALLEEWRGRGVEVVTTWKVLEELESRE